MTTPKYPDITAQLAGKDGNAFSVLATVNRALKLGGVPAPIIKDFMNEAMSGDYHHLLATAMEWVNVE